MRSTLYYDRANEFVSTLNQSTMPGVIYDTAIVGSLKDNLGYSIFSNQVKVVLEEQHEDGSWGSSYYNPFDRLLTTIASMYMITELGLQNDPSIQNKYEKASIWMEEHFKSDLDYVYPAPAGFEFLFPHFAKKVMKAGNTMSLNLSELEKSRQYKLEKLGNTVFSRPSPLLYSMEGIVDNHEVASLLANFQSANGSLAASPATTTLYIKHNVDEAIPRAFRFIQKSILPDQKVIHFNDYDYMNIAFSLHPLFKADYQFGAQALHITNLLSKGWTENGISFGKAFPSPDADDTAVALVDLYHLGEKTTKDKLNILLKYEREDYFKTYFSEVGPSLMTNMHVLEAFLLIPHPRGEEIVEKLNKFVKKSFIDSRKVSKYNSSVIIQLSGLILTLLPELPELSRSHINNLQRMVKQKMDNPDQERIIVEEYANALLALLFAKKHGIMVESSIIYHLHNKVREMTYYGVQFDETYTWSAKVQYSPTKISRAYVIAALMLYNQLME